MSDGLPQPARPSPDPSGEVGRRASRLRRRFAAVARGAAVVAGVGLVVGAAVAGGLWNGFRSYAASLPPLDLRVTSVQSTIVIDREGRLLRPFTTEDGRWRLPVTAADVDPRFLDMLTAFEDARFRRHAGVDPLAMVRAAGQMVLNRRVVSGGSTLTMQVARLLEPREDRTIGAKLRQVARAFELERRFSKTEILSLYLNLAPYGGNIEGIRAASFAYFGKEPKRLGVAEAALLVALPQSPEMRRPDRNPAAALAARDRVLGRALARHVIAGPEVVRARLDGVPTARLPFPMIAPHAAEAAVAERPEAKLHRLTIDLRLQKSLETLVRDRVEPLGPKLSAAVVVVDNASGEVLASVSGPDYFSAERAGSVDLTAAMRSPGSALKPFIYALAFENGLAHPETMVEDRPTRYGAWAPENFDQSFHGLVTARKALQMSLNMPAVEMLEAVGPARLIARLKGAGAEIALPKDGGAPGLAVGLGGLGIRLEDLARLYVGLARGGDTVPLVRRIGEHFADRDRLRLTDRVSAWYIADVLRGAPPPVNAPGGRIAYKTGTSYGYRDAWAVGFDRRFTVAVWVGRPDGAPVPGLVGRVVAAPILFDAYQRLGAEPEPIPQPMGALIATTATLPPPLRHMRKDVPKTLAATVDAELKISFPPDGARIDAGFAGGTAPAEASPLALKALGGVPPLVWLVNGVPVSTVEGRRPAFWQPDGAGFAQVSVIDAKGATATVRVRLE